jgi:hypothetical protein
VKITEFLTLQRPGMRKISVCHCPICHHLLLVCGRYRLSRRKQIITEHFDVVSGEEDWSPRYNIAPTQPIPVIRQNPKEPVRFRLKGALIPFFHSSVCWMDQGERVLQSPHWEHGECGLKTKEGLEK